MAWAITSTDLWYDADGMVAEEAELPFFYVSDAETQHVTIDGIRYSGIDAGKVVYLAGVTNKGHGYAPTVRQTVNSAVASLRKTIGVSAHPAKAGDKIGVYTDGVVKVTCSTGSNNPSISLGRRIQGTYLGQVVSAADYPVSAIAFGRAIQSAGSGDEFLALIGRGY